MNSLCDREIQQFVQVQSQVEIGILKVSHLITECIYDRTYLSFAQFNPDNLFVANLSPSLNC
jgi:hypothetical protein